MNKPIKWNRNFSCPSYPDESLNEIRIRLKGSIFEKNSFKLWLKLKLNYLKLKIFYTYWVSEDSFYHRQPRFWKYKINSNNDLGVWSFGEFKFIDLSQFKTKTVDIDLKKLFKDIIWMEQEKMKNKMCKNCYETNTTR